MGTQITQFDGAASAMPVSMAVNGSYEPLESAPATDGKVLPFDLANVPADYWARATEPDRMRDMGIGRKDVMLIPPSVIKVDPKHNPRDYRLKENRDHLDDLKRKIKAAGGVLRALECRWDFFNPNDTVKSVIVVDGECRLRASLELIAEGEEIAFVPVQQSDAKTETDRLIRALMLNEGKSLSQWEMGNAFKRMLTGKFTIEMIVERTGHKEKFIEDAIAMADAPEEIKEMLSAQAVTPWAVLSALKVMHPDRAVETLQAQVAEKQAKGEKGPVKRSKAPAKASTTTPTSQAKVAPAKSTIPASNITKAILALVEDVPAGDLNETDMDSPVVVKLGRLLKVLSFAVTEDDLKSVGIEATTF